MVRRNAGDVDNVHVLLPDVASRRISVFTCSQRHDFFPKAGKSASGGSGSDFDFDWDPGVELEGSPAAEREMETDWQRKPGGRACTASCRQRRNSLFRPFDNRATAAKLVRK